MAWYGMVWQGKTGQGKTGRDGTGQDRKGQEREGRDRISKPRTTLGTHGGLAFIIDYMDGSSPECMSRQCRAKDWPK